MGIGPIALKAIILAIALWGANKIPFQPLRIIILVLLILIALVWLLSLGGFRLP